MLFGIAVAIHGLKKGCLFEPLHIYFFVHPFVLGACLLELLGYRNGFGSRFIGVLILSYVAFFLGGSISHRGDVQKQNWESRPARIDLVVIVFGIVALLLLSRLAGGWPMLSVNPSVARLELFGNRINPQLFEAGMLAAFVSVANLVLYRNLWMLFPIFVLLLEISLTGNRGQILQIVVFGLALSQFRWKYRLFWPVLLSSVGFLIMFIGIGFSRAFSSNAGDAVTLFASVQMLYAYLCNGYWNFALGFERYVMGGVAHTWGTSVLGGLWFWGMNLGQLQMSYGWDVGAFNSSIVKYAGLNSATYMWAMIKDFGIGGMLIANFLYGFILVRIYRRGMGDRRFALVYSALAFQLLVSFNILWSNEGLSMYTFVIVSLYAFFAKARSN